MRYTIITIEFGFLVKIIIDKYKTIDIIFRKLSTNRW